MKINKKKVNLTLKAHLFHSPINQKWLPCQILGGKTVRNAQIGHKQRRSSKLNVIFSYFER